MNPDIDLSTLEAVYGPSAPAQVVRYRESLDRFVQIYGWGSVKVFRAPGRVNLIGEHTDYNHGYVLPVALDQDLLLFLRPRTDTIVTLTNMESDFAPVSFDLSSQSDLAQKGGWGTYARGMAKAFVNRFSRERGERPIRGFDGLINGAPPHGLPRGSGLSSSSALTVVIGIALAWLAKWAWQASEMAQLCSDGEWHAGTRGGIMDQLVSLLGQPDHALFIDCRPDGAGHYHTRPIPLSPAYRLMIVESGVQHANAENEFNARVAACRAGVALLQKAYPQVTHLRDVEHISWGNLAPLLPIETSLHDLKRRGILLADLPNVTDTMPLRIRSCCRHVWRENRRVQNAVTALCADEVERLGQLLLEGHASARDDYQISTPELDILVQAAMQVDGCAGARLTGAGWGGCIIALVQAGAEEAFTSHVSTVYERKIGRRPRVFTCRAGGGAGLILER